jgi:hypothetical protein
MVHNDTLFGYKVFTRRTEELLRLIFPIGRSILYKNRFEDTFSMYESLYVRVTGEEKITKKHRQGTYDASPVTFCYK